MATSNLFPDIYVPTFEMVAGGRKLEPAIAKTILEVSVTEHLDPPNQFSFRLNDPTLKFIKKEDGRFTEGTHIEIGLSYVGNTRNLMKLIVGEISALTANFPSSGPATLDVQGFDVMNPLTRGTIYRKFEGSKPNNGLPDSEIVSQIASEMGLKSSVDTTWARTEPRVQDNKSNLAFLEELAQANGYFLWVDRDTLYFKRDRPAPKPNTIRLEWGKTLMSFSARLSTAGQVNEVEVRGWDPVQKQSLSARVKRRGTVTAKLAPTGQKQIDKGTGGRSERIIAKAPVSNAQEAEAYAKAILAQQSLISGNGVSVGNPEIRVGTTLELSGIGRFDGSYTVTQVTHTLNDNGYQTSFQVDSVLHSPDLPSLFDGRDRNRVYGVVVGIVIGNKDIGIGRVRVKYPGMSDNEIGHMARVATLMAGQERGTLFLPEENDEVLIAFEQGDIARPYVIGALWNGKDKPPDSNANGKNNLRFIKSRSGHLVRLDDTEHNEKIEIIDKTGKNSLTFDTASNTVTIKSDKDVVIEAPKGRISLSAKNVEIQSNADTKVQAQTTMDIKASETLAIKGKPVNIN